MPGIRSSTRGRRQESRDLTTSFKPTALPFHRHGQGRDKDEDLDANNVFGNHASGSQGDDASHEDNSGDSSKDGGSGGNSDSDKSDPSNASQSSGGADGKSNSGIPGSNGSNDDQGHEDSFPGFCGAAPNPIPLDPSQCVFVNENDGRLKYGPGWTLATSDPSGERRTSHSTSTNGSSVVVDFNSTSIIVFGTVPQSNATFAPPSASYSIDGRRPIELMLPIASMCIPNQQLFRSPELPHGAHNLTISVTTLNGTSYTLDYLWFCTDKPTQSSNSTGVETKAVTKGDKFSRLDGIILGSVLGSVLFLLLIAALVWCLVRRRRRSRRLRQLHIAASPVSSWLHWNSRSGGSAAGTEVPFTSTESILRSNPSYSDRTTSKGSKRSAVISMPVPNAPLPDLTALPPGLGPAPFRPVSVATIQRGERTSLTSSQAWAHVTRSPS